jgi:hypothetical protein
LLLVLVLPLLLLRAILLPVPVLPLLLRLLRVILLPVLVLPLLLIGMVFLFVLLPLPCVGRSGDSEK